MDSLGMGLNTKGTKVDERIMVLRKGGSERLLSEPEAGWELNTEGTEG